MASLVERRLHSPTTSSFCLVAEFTKKNFYVNETVKQLQPLGREKTKKTCSREAQRNFGMQ